MLAGSKPAIPGPMGLSQPPDTAADTADASPARKETGKLADATPRVRSVLLVDPLDGWRRTLFSSMSTDAQKRMQALFVGPRPPAVRVSRQLDGNRRTGDARPEGRDGSAKLLKKTSRVLQRTKKHTALRAKRRAAEKTGKIDPLYQAPLKTPTAGKSKGNGIPSP